MKKILEIFALCFLSTTVIVLGGSLLGVPDSILILICGLFGFFVVPFMVNHEEIEKD